MILDYLYETLSAGWMIIFSIFIVGTWAFCILFKTVNMIGLDMYKKDFTTQFEKLEVLLEEKKREDAKAYLKKQTGVVAKTLLQVLNTDAKSSVEMSNALKEQLFKSFHSLEKGLSFVGVMAAVTPLLGLLGTVTGMVSTFEVITLYGNSNPMLMAGGISEALITTQSGLIVAFPIVLLKHRVEDRLNWVKKQIELGVTLILKKV